MRTSYLDYDGEPARLIYADDNETITEADVLRDGKWVPIHWSELLFKAKDATKAQMAEIAEASGTR